MSRSIFDPTGPNTERSGNPFMGPDADDRSRMPESAVDGIAGDSEDANNDIIDMNPEPQDSPDRTPPDSK